MFQLWNNQSCNSFKANFQSEVLDLQQLEIAKLIDLISNQQQQIISASLEFNIAKVEMKEISSWMPAKPSIISNIRSSKFSIDKTKNISKKNETKRRRKNKQRCFLEGRWTHREHNQYLSFLEQNIKFMCSSDSKREQQIFKQMSELIRSRTAAQCRSHHKKFDYKRYLNQKSQNSSQVSEQ